MDQEFQNNEFRNVPHDAEAFGMVRKDAEDFGKIPKGAESFRSVPKHSERKENHTLTVRETARMFEAAGVGRTERSIINWCQPNKDGIARLDCYFDPNERKYFITQQSAESAIEEEKARMVKSGDRVSEGDGSGEKISAARNESAKPSASHEDSEQAKAVEKELMDLKILNGGKDFLIEQLRKERDNFIQQIVSGSRRIGQLEVELRQLSAPKYSSEERRNSDFESREVDEKPGEQNLTH